MLESDVDGRCMLTEGAISMGKRGAAGRHFLAGLKKLQNAQRKAANSYSSWSAIPNKEETSQLIHFQFKLMFAYHYAYNIVDKPLQIYSRDRRLLNNQPFYQPLTFECYL